MNPVQQPNIPLNQTTGMVCEECDSNLFTEAVFLRQVSRFIANTPKDAIMPIPTFACLKCHHVNAEFDPTKQAGNEQA